MKTVNLFGIKGGVGTTTVAAALAIITARLGIGTIGVSSRWTDEDALAAVLGTGTLPNPGTMVLPDVRFGRDPREGDPRVSIVDCGSELRNVRMTSPGDVNLIVARGCYIGLRRYTREVGDWNRSQFHGVILLDEPGRALAKREVGDVTGLPVLATIPTPSVK